MKQLSGLSALRGLCDAMLVDQFGTLHDGTAAYPGALEALARLRDAGIRVAILSNSGKRAVPNGARLRRMGITADLYAGLLTSGEAGWRMLAQNRVPHATRPGRCMLLSRDNDRSLLDGTGWTTVEAPETADLLVIAGSEGDQRPLAEYRAMLAPLAQRGVPALCLNPDKLMLIGSTLAFGAGQIADAYESLGGIVTWVGKPHLPIYAEALADLAPIAAGRVVGIGDSVEHDIAGGRNAGCQTALVRTGIIHAATDEELGAAFTGHRARPDWIIDRFTW